MEYRETWAMCRKPNFPRTRLDYRDMQRSDYQQVEKVFENFRQKLSLLKDADVLKCEDQSIDLRIVYVNDDESISSS